MDDLVPYQDIGCVIKQVRCEYNLSKAALARQLQARANTATVTTKTISRWEKGIRIPGPYWRSHLALTLDIPPADLEHTAKVARRNRLHRQPGL